ncbi:MAG: aminomethyl-transferring glycine dehydrogenase subunit GcvPA [Deltaproteobacteria bacterium]|nr:aminomethyl-transferring glycine dehydrogenase subunit GcvPA [Deltaproteobacteria bacterium]
MAFTPHTDNDIVQMLKVIGANSIDDLFKEIPAEVRNKKDLKLEAPLSESEVLRELQRLANRNATPETHRSFLGGGTYNHFIPAVVDFLTSRSEFATAYTPYQSEISQGTLQAIFEFQTLICQITGMEAANASMYDGASACAEAALMAARLTRRKKILTSRALHPEYRETLATYCRFLEMELIDLSFNKNGETSLEDLQAHLDDQTAGVILGYPNFFGVIENIAPLAPLVHDQGAKLVVAVQEAASLGLIKAPGALGADIVIGEGQSFGIPPAFGGPHAGFFAVRQKDVRSIPGRLVGETVDQEGKRGYVLTLSTREQHIRREKATSNICSNHGLCALRATVYLSLLGKDGLRTVAVQNHSKAEYAKQQISAVDGFTLPFSAPTFNEFVIEAKEPVEQVMARLESNGILGGIPLQTFYPEMENHFLVCVTEQNSREDIDILVQTLGTSRT